MARFETSPLHLVEQRAITDVQEFRRFHPVPACLLQHLEDFLTFRAFGGPANDVLEEYGRRLACRECPVLLVSLSVEDERDPREARVVQDDQPLDRVFEFPDVAWVAVL